jgi:flagellar export protein FliJ
VPKFTFRLQKVLEFREAVEARAKEQYLDARAARLEAEVESSGIEARRQEALAKPADDLADRQALELMMIKLDADQRNQQSVVAILAEEEEKAMAEWHERRKELEALVKLRDKALADWQLNENRREQNELDEWSVLRRKAD